jgi:hypothetical protein
MNYLVTGGAGLPDGIILDQFCYYVLHLCLEKQEG